MSAGRLPLAGIRILDLGQFWAAPSAGRTWADLGAEVIKIEACSRPDPLRIQARGIYPDHEPGTEHWNRSGMVNERNRGKLGLTLDLANPRGRELFLDLVRHSDVVSHNFSTRVLPSLGLDFAALAAANPTIVVVSIMSQGLEGPESEFVSYGQNLEQLGGISYLSGYPDDETSSVGFALPDPLGGATAALALIAALRQRDASSRAIHVDLSQREAATLVVGDALVEASVTGVAPGRVGNHEPGAVPSECYPCRGDDRWIAISIRGDAEWASLCQAMGRPELANEQQYATVIGRLRNRAAVDALIGDWTKRFEPEEALVILQQHGVPAGAVFSPRELFRDPHLRSRGFWECVEDPAAGVQEYYGRPYRLSAVPVATRRPTPLLGEHNREILQGVLGLADSTLAELEREGVIGTRPLLGSSGRMAKG